MTHPAKFSQKIRLKVLTTYFVNYSPMSKSPGTACMYHAQGLALQPPVAQLAERWTVELGIASIRTDFTLISSPHTH